MLDAWLGQDDLLRSPSDQTIRSVAAAAWLPLWNTEDMQGLLRYIAASQTTAHPLYLASMDIQPAQGGSPAK